MNRTIKIILIIAGVALLGYGAYTLVSPETLASIGPLDIKSQDNSNSYIVIGLGIIALAFGLLFAKKK